MRLIKHRHRLRRSSFCPTLPCSCKHCARVVGRNSEKKTFGKITAEWQPIIFVEVCCDAPYSLLQVLHGLTASPDVGESEG